MSGLHRRTPFRTDDSFPSLCFSVDLEKPTPINHLTPTYSKLSLLSFRGNRISDALLDSADISPSPPVKYPPNPPCYESSGELNARSLSFPILVGLSGLFPSDHSSFFFGSSTDFILAWGGFSPDHSMDSGSLFPFAGRFYLFLFSS